MPVHPHVRGDLITKRDLEAPGPGSPPRAWGPFGNHVHYTGEYRFTPTCVGTLGDEYVHQIAPPVHPHVRGDLVISYHGQVIAIGSPPRAWGPFVERYRLEAISRFTPTCVGTFPTDISNVVLCKVHPHVRGDL